MVAVPLGLNFVIIKNKRSHFKIVSEERAGPVVISVVIVISLKPVETNT